MRKFNKFVYVPGCSTDIMFAIAASRAGGIGVLDHELCENLHLIPDQLEQLSEKAKGDFGIKLSFLDDQLLSALIAKAPKGLRWVIFDSEEIPNYEKEIFSLRRHEIRVLAETIALCPTKHRYETLVDGLILKGNEAGGFIGEYSSFIMLQQWRNRTSLPLYIRGGLTPGVAAACTVMGVKGGVFDSQVLLLDDSPFAKTLLPFINHLTGNETVAVGDAEKGRYFRLFVRPGFQSARSFVEQGTGRDTATLKKMLVNKTDWESPARGILPLGQDVCFAGPWRNRYGHLSDLFQAVDTAVTNYPQHIVQSKPMSLNAPLAKILGTRWPLVQGPMARVSDCPEFADAVSQGGALPVLALGLTKGETLNGLLKETAQKLEARPWGIGLLGFAPQALLDEQLSVLKPYRPHVAIIAGGRPDQAITFEKEGIISFLHVPSADLIPLFLREGARRFIFEGRECGGHIGPLSSFILWSKAVESLVAEIDSEQATGDDIQVLFAGGIHDAISSAMVQVLAAPLVERGVRIGFIMGSGYLFTREIVDTGAVVPLFQEEVIGCCQTVNLESGPGHASRCAYTPFAQSFFTKRRELLEKGIPADKLRETLDSLIMGKLRVATKGKNRSGEGGKLMTLPQEEQRREGMYMLGQLAVLRTEATDIDTLHRGVTVDAGQLLETRLKAIKSSRVKTIKSLDIALIGIACLLPKANSPLEFWQNILAKVNAITEIPPHRWDWRLYYDKDRHAKDKICSKWGGFIDDLVFDPTRYGIPPKSIESVDPMQLMALEVARRTLADAGYENRNFDRERTSVIIGASGGAGDVGMQYGLRAELPRFYGALPDSVGERLPEWTEDSFAGILLNVIAGRISNRLNLGGVNFTTDAACASAMATIYQGVAELDSGRSNLVIAGGVDTVQGPFGYLCFSKTQALSTGERCAALDTEADGIVIAEGIAMVAMKRLEDAERDGDRIYAVIKGVGGGSDGRSKGLTAPRPKGQLRAMQRAYDQAGFGADTIDLFEAHGTGTLAGDTAELKSTSDLVRQSGGRPHQAVIGSVKTLIGHTKATAGIPALIKATLALHHRVFPPHYGVRHPNPILLEPDNPLYLIDEPRPWLATTEKPRRAAVSAFGFGGTNFHVLLEEYRDEYRPWLRSAVMQRWPAELLLWSASNREELIARLLEVRQPLEHADSLELRDLAFNLARLYVRNHDTIAIVATDITDLLGKMDKAINRLKHQGKISLPGVYYSNQPLSDGKVAVLFSGQGSQYVDMMRELAVNFPVLADTLSEADEVLKACFALRFGQERRLSHFMFPRGVYGKAAIAEANRALAATDVAQPALGAVEAGLWRLMCHFDLEADMLGGHSYGEFVALFAGGVFDFTSLMSLSEARGRFIVDAAQKVDAELGKMAAVNAERETVEKMLAQVNDVIVANHNAPRQVVISGSGAGIGKAIEKFSSAGIRATEIPVAAAFHSSFVEPARVALADMIQKSGWGEAAIPVYSNTSGKLHAQAVADVQQVMTEHLIKPVEFLTQIETMYQDGARVFLEIGPKSVLTGLVDRILGGREGLATAVDGNGGGIKGLLHAFGRLITAGVKLDITKLFEGRECVAGDPADMDRLKRHESVPAHAWLLNGSRARRATEPLRQIGVRMDEAIDPARNEAKDNRPLSPSVKMHTQAPEHGQEPLTCKPQPQIKDNRKEEPRMRGRGRAPFAGDPAIMAEYFDMMRQFLETQERVMSMYMGGVTNQEFSSREPGAIRRRVASPKQESGMADFAVQNSIRQHFTPPDLTYSRSKHADNPPSIPAEAAVPTAKPVEASSTSEQMMPEIPEENKAKSGVSSPHPEKSDAAADTRRDQNKRVELQQMTDMLLAIVEEQTGYPRDMLGLDQKLEAELGVDSIKRIQIVGALLEALPPGYNQALGENRAELNTQTTLNGILKILDKLEPGGKSSVPFGDAGMGSTAVNTALSFRHIIEPRQESIDAQVKRLLNPGCFILTPDTLGLAEKIAFILGERGCKVLTIPRQMLSDENALMQWCNARQTEIGDFAGIVHLAPVGAESVSMNAPPSEWQRLLQSNEKVLFILLRQLGPNLIRQAHIISVSALGGYFSRRDHLNSPGLFLQGGGVGLLKSVLEERPEFRVKAIDIDPGQPVDLTARWLIEEMAVVGGRQEVGYPQGKRTIFETVAADMDNPSQDEGAICNKVVLATGGAKGVTAELLRELALPGNTLLLTGRSPLPEDETEALRACADSAALREYFITEVREGRLKLSPAEIQRQVKTVSAARELRNNIEDFNQRGAAVEYFAVDVTDDDAMARMFSTLYDKYGRLDGIVHGAGIIEDKLLQDKSAESWSRVVETKVMGLLLLQKYARADDLKFFTVMSSVAGRYGNSGQTDYATANELMNRLCCQLSRIWHNRVKVKAFCWGPWAATTFGAGMVTTDTEAKFAQKGVTLVTPSVGRRLFKDELSIQNEPHVEVVCGAGPWEAHEKKLGSFEIASVNLDGNDETPAAPMLAGATVRSLSQGETEITFTLDSVHAYLQDHQIDGVPVLPAAAALEMMSEAVSDLWPGRHVVEARDCRLMKGIELKDRRRPFNLIIKAPMYGGTELTEVNAVIRSRQPDGRHRLHYRCVLGIGSQIPAGSKHHPSSHYEKQLTVDKAYNEWLFHGPRFQVIEKIHGLSEQGATALVKTTFPSQWLNRKAGCRQWIFDPAVVDAAAQMAWLWDRAFRDESALPARLGRVTRYCESLPERLLMHFERIPTHETHMVRANVYFTDQEHNLMLLIEDLESVSSAELNRLGGSAGNHFRFSQS